MAALRACCGLIVVVTALSALPAAAAAPATDPPVISVLSTRADLVSGGDALVRITLPPRAAGWRYRVSISDRREVTGQFRRVSPTVLEGLVTKLKLGVNTINVRLPDYTGAALKVVNHPTGGPVFAGPQIQPWKCQKEALDRQCNQAPTYEYQYKSTDPFKNGLQDYDRKSPPRDVASITTENGTTMPFIVRVETGYVARDQYKIATLFDPRKPWTIDAPQPQYAHKLLITHGASCDIAYEQGGAPSVTKYNPNPIPFISLDTGERALARGFAVMSTAADNSGHNCNVVTQAESLLMAKERVIEQYGTVRYTIGAGCSGGALAQYWIANAYPGIYQGILPTCSFPDAWSSAIQVMDYHLLRRYFEKADRIVGGGVTWNLDQWAAVEGSGAPLNAIISDIGFYDAIIPDRECDGLDDKDVYNAKKNPTGVRCSIADFNINIFGPFPQSRWAELDKQLGHSLGHNFSDIPVDNTGVQYGLDALNRGIISPAQFVDVNAKIGGLDPDGESIPDRIKADPVALANTYRSGSINEANNMGGTAVIDCRGPDPGFAHDAYRPYAVRARLDRANGGHGNQLIWQGPLPLIGDLQCAPKAFDAMDRWLSAVEADTSAAPLEQKVVADRPSDLGDACLDGGGGWLNAGACADGVVPIYGTARTVAGEDITTDANKCQLKPLVRASYSVAFTDAQWAQLVKTFPSGVCDYTKLGVEQQRTIPWLQYGSADSVIYGGAPLGAAPTSRELVSKDR